LFNYPEFDHLRSQKDTVEQIFMGYNFQPESLSPEWEARIEVFREQQTTILITLGTFLSARADVLSRCITTITKAYPNALCIVAGGASTQKLAELQSDRVVIEEFIPQKALLPHADLVIHHGGCNSFTETLFFGKPMIIMPFSSDQFAIASDAQRYELAACLDPNHFTPDDLITKATMLLGEGQHQEQLQAWRNHVVQRGPNYAAHRLQP
jgi:UDP:flavonoid glycosyltransferase YjiC (YdhE family)